MSLGDGAKGEQGGHPVPSGLPESVAASRVGGERGDRLGEGDSVARRDDKPRRAEDARAVPHIGCDAGNGARHRFAEHVRKPLAEARRDAEDVEPRQQARDVAALAEGGKTGAEIGRDGEGVRAAADQHGAHGVGRAREGGEEGRVVLHRIDPRDQADEDGVLRPAKLCAKARPRGWVGAETLKIEAVGDHEGSARAVAAGQVPLQACLAVGKNHIGHA